MIFLEESAANEQNIFPAPPKSKSIIYVTMIDGLQIIRCKYIYFRKIIYTQRELFLIRQIYYYLIMNVFMILKNIFYHMILK